MDRVGLPAVRLRTRYLIPAPPVGRGADGAAGAAAADRSDDYWVWWTGLIRACLIAVSQFLPEEGGAGSSPPAEPRPQQGGRRRRTGHFCWRPECKLIGTSVCAQRFSHWQFLLRIRASIKLGVKIVQSCIEFDELLELLFSLQHLQQALAQLHSDI